MHQAFQDDLISNAAKLNDGRIKPSQFVSEVRQESFFKLTAAEEYKYY